MTTTTTTFRPVNRLAARVGRYFDRHPEVNREQFLVDAVRKEIDRREQREGGTGLAHPDRSELSAEDIRIHTWLTERLEAVSRERRGFWPNLRRLLFGAGRAL
jgi:hypothetical protein